MKRPRILAALLLLLAGTSVSAVPPAGDPPLTNEDVVRMAASGRSEPEILRVIAASAVDFDLERDMLEELRRAGLSETILAAMRERQAVAGAHPQAPLAALPEPPRGTLALSFVPLDEPGGKGAPSFRMVKKIPRWAVQRMDMEEKAEVEDLAWFVACATPEHVPDHWQDRSPVHELRRHEMLRFLPGSRAEKVKGFEVLALALPAALELAVPEGTHFLVIGVAAKIGPDWRPVASAERRDVLVASGRTTRIVVGAKGKLAGSAMKGFKEEQGVTIVEVGPPGGKP